MTKALQPSAAILISFGLLAVLSACQAPKNTAYFQTLQRDTTLQALVTKNFDVKIVPDDVLTVSIASSSPELSGLFNAAQGTGGGEGAAAGYQVDKNGNIQLYKLGKLKVAGLTRAELKEKLETDLAPYLKDPVVTVRFANHRVTVLGEVGAPGVLPLQSDQMNLLEAIGKSGDLTKEAKRNNILVIRQTEKGKEFKHLNLLDHSIFSSPYYYLQNEDVVYVEPEKDKKSAQNTQQVVSYVLTGVSLFTLLLSRIK